MNKRDFLKYLCAGTCASFFIGSDSILFSKPNNTKEAYHYINNTGRIECNLCPNGCFISNNKTGDCKTRRNINGKLYTIAYNNPCAINIDPIEKKPLYHFLPQTKSYSLAIAGCNFTCLNCQNWSISQFSPDETQNYFITSQQIVESCLKNDCKSISYTYSEPVVFYEYMFDTAKLAKSKGIKNIMVSNGYINQKPLKIGRASCRERV